MNQEEYINNKKFNKEKTILKESNRISGAEEFN